jgi:hypothetical protein
MRQHRGIATVVSAVLLAAAVAACKSEPPPPPAPPPAPAAQAFTVTGIELGKQINADNRVTEQVTVFAPGDTIYASVLSNGAAPTVVIKARWTYEDGQLVSESSESIVPTGPAATQFHIAKPSGWPSGKYKVEIAANNAVVGSKDFEVR